MVMLNKAGQRSRYSRSSVDPRSRAIGRAWERFVTASGDDQAQLPVRNVIARSWQRCRSGGVDPTRMTAPRLIDDNGLFLLHESNRLLLECSSMAIDQGRRFLEETGAIMLVTNAEGLTLEVVGDPGTLYDAQQIGLVQGSGWPEVLSGSNAVGTAIENNGAIQIHGQEHYCEGFKPWTCTATVIRDPYDGECVGVLDISGLVDSYHRCHLPLVVSWCSLIEAGLAKKMAETEARMKALPRRYIAEGQLLFDRAGHLLGADDALLAPLVGPEVELKDLRRCRLVFSEDRGVVLTRGGRTLGVIDADRVEPIKQRSETLGFRLILPATSGAPRKTARPADTPTPFTGIIGESPAIRETIARAAHVALAPLPVLLLGETGVGKEVFARAIHETGPTRSGPFIDLNCGALSRDILASELFGHVEGAFTGAKRGGMTGKVEAAAGGTLFLDEIGEMPLELQPMFLRVLQEKRFYRIGDVVPRAARFRLIAATNRDLSEDVNAGRFRKDLYFRISTMPLIVPPLRDRSEDVALIARHVLDRCRREHPAIVARDFSPALLRQLEQRHWPGNVRELANAIEAMGFLARHEVLTPDDLPPDTLAEQPRPVSLDSLDDAEAGVIARAVEACRGNLTEVSRRLRISKSTLYQKLRKYGIERPASADM